MKSLLVTNDYASLSEVEGLRVVYDKTTDFVWIDTPSLYDFVDLGLPSGLKWADRNVGASAPEDFGLYFAWGETQGYTDEDIEKGVKKFNWNDYKLCEGSSQKLTKYNNDSSYGIVDNLTTLELVDDAAYVSDNTCRMPIDDDFEELIANTTSTWETLNGVNGRRFTSKTNGNSIFVPAAGYYNISSVDGVGVRCNLWSSFLSNNSSNPIPLNSNCLYFNSSYADVTSISRSVGVSIRSVK